MSNIKAKVGKCVDCGPSSPDVYIMAGRCYCNPPFHYQKHKEAVYKARQAKKKASKAPLAGEMTIGKWFNFQINQMPRYCENCGTYLDPYAPWSARAYIAHIVPKRRFESVKVHLMNRMFLCIDCHTNYDNGLSKEIKASNVYSVAVKRFKLFADQIDASEIKDLQPFLYEVYFEGK